MSKSLRHRRDVRTEEQFKQDILAASKRENEYVHAWAKYMRMHGHTVDVYDHGVDNSGAFVEKSNNNADFKIKLNGVEGLYECKQNPFDHRNTFKKYDLECYIEQKANILLFYGLGKTSFTTFPETARWAIITPEEQQKILDEIKPTKGDRAWGYKEVCIIYSKHFNKYFKSQEFDYAVE